jgi:hypothetical protein
MGRGPDIPYLKRSGRNEPMWIAIHMCMEAMLGICLYSYLYPKLAKNNVFLIISYVFSSTKSEKRAEQVLPASRGLGSGRSGGKRAQTMYADVSKCKKDKIKGEKNFKKELSFLRCSRVNMVEILYTHVCKWKNEIC